MHKDKNDFKMGYQPRIDSVNDEKGNLVADSYNIFNRLKYNCATGAPAEIVQAAGRTVYSKILSLILFRINKQMSQQWKESIIAPIYGKGYKTDCNNY